MNTSIPMSRNAVVAYFKKPASELTRQDIIEFIGQNGIEMINFMYPASDGRLKTLNFVINSPEYLETILTLGERVDGSSLFKGIDAGASDLYVIPRYRTAFVDPFAPIPTLTMLCSFCDKDGRAMPSAPQNILHNACRVLTETTGVSLRAMGELEFYVISPDTGQFPATDQRGYHESSPFAKSGDFRTRCMQLIAQTGGMIKYGHSEVGNFTLDGVVYEQNEIEFLPVDAEEAADQLMIAEWIIRTQAWKEGLDVTFAPKIAKGKAGSGLHIHMQLMRNGQPCMLGANGCLSEEARKAIAGLMMTADAITAFGNTDPTSYFRLVPHQEAPTSICWGDRNRSVLVRVPLGWTSGCDMCAEVNPLDSTPANINPLMKQTFEIRSADGTADIYLLLASLAVAIRYGLTHPEALKIAEDTYVDINIHAAESEQRAAHLRTLPTDCTASADALESKRGIFEAYEVFPPQTIAATEEKLRAYGAKQN